MRPRPLAGLVTVVVLLAGGCSGVDDSLVAQGEVTDLSGLGDAPAPELAEALETPGGLLVDELALTPTPGVTDGERSVVVTGGALTGFDAADPTDDEQTWTTQIPDGICGTSRIDDDRVAVLRDPGIDLGRCTRVSVVDVQTGEVAWTRDLGAGLVTTPGVSLGGGLVWAGGVCGEVLRWDAATGQPRSTVAPADDGCDTESAFGDDVVAIWQDAVDPSVGDDLAPGFDPPYDGAGRLRVIDIDAGEQLWQRPLDSDGTELDGVVTTDPVVLDLTEDGHRTLRRFDDSGEPVGYVGPQLSTTAGFDVVARSGDVVAGTYEGEPTTYAFDLGTGEELWRTDQGKLAGADDGDLVWVRVATVASSDGPERQLQVVRTAPTDPVDGELLGAVTDLGAGVVLLGDDLVRSGARSSSVLALPAEPVGPAPAPLPTAVDLLDWAPDDVRPEALTGLLGAVDDAPLERLGLRTDLPPPRDGRWRPDTPGPRLLLDVGVVAHGPLGDDTAVETAESEYARSEGAREVLGLGDEARVEVGGTRARPEVQVWVRRGNVVVDVEILTFTRPPSGSPRRLGPDELERVALDVAEDLVAAV